MGSAQENQWEMDILKHITSSGHSQRGLMSFLVSKGYRQGAEKVGIHPWGVGNKAKWQNTKLIWQDSRLVMRTSLKLPNAKAQTGKESSKAGQGLMDQLWAQGVILTHLLRLELMAFKL